MRQSPLAAHCLPHTPHHPMSKVLALSSKPHCAQWVATSRLIAVGKSLPVSFAMCDSGDAIVAEQQTKSGEEP